jgi:hypothetical protein
MSRKDAVVAAPADKAASNGAADPGHEFRPGAKTPR